MLTIHNLKRIDNMKFQDGWSVVYIIPPTTEIYTFHIRYNGGMTGYFIELHRESNSSGLFFIELFLNKTSTSFLTTKEMQYSFLITKNNIKNLNEFSRYIELLISTIELNKMADALNPS